MKKNTFTLGWFFLSLLIVFAVTACGDDEEETSVAVTFPEKQLIGGNALTSHELKFHAAADWQLTTSATWCYFGTEEQKEYSLSGEAGEQTVTVHLSADGQEYDQNSVATLSLQMNGVEAIIAEVTRNPLGRELKIFQKGANGQLTEIQEITAGYDEFAPFVVRANFRFAATDRPEWLLLEGGSIIGAANQEVTGGVQVVDQPAFFKYAQQGTLVFQDEAGKCTYSFPVKYAGMNKEKMLYEGPGKWNWEVSLDGTLFTHTVEGVAGSEETQSEYRRFVEFSVAAFNDDVKAIFVEKYNMQGMTMWKTSLDTDLSEEEAVNWMHMEHKGNGNIRLTVSEGSKEREGYVLVFPAQLYEKIAKDVWNPENGLFESSMNEETGSMDMFIKYVYEEANLLMNVVQKERKQSVGDEDAFTVTFYNANWEQQTVAAEKVSDEYGYGIEAVYSIAQPDTKMAFNVDPHMEGIVEEDWVFEIRQDGKPWPADPNTATFEANENKLDVWFAEPLTKAFHILFKEKVSDKLVKVLIVTPKK